MLKRAIFLIEAFLIGAILMIGFGTALWNAGVTLWNAGVMLTGQLER